MRLPLQAAKAKRDWPAADATHGFAYSIRLHPHTGRLSRVHEIGIFMHWPVPCDHEAHHQHQRHPRQAQDIHDPGGPDEGEVRTPQRRKGKLQ